MDKKVHLGWALHSSSLESKTGSNCNNELGSSGSCPSEDLRSDQNNDKNQQTGVSGISLSEEVKLVSGVILSLNALIDKISCTSETEGLRYAPG